MKRVKRTWGIGMGEQGRLDWTFRLLSVRRMRRSTDSYRGGDEFSLLD